MAYPLEFGDVVQVVFEGIHDNQQTITVMNYTYSDIVSNPDGKTAVTNLLGVVTGGNGLLDKYLACISGDVKAIKAYGQHVTQVRHAYVASPTPAQDGGILLPALPANTAQVVTRRGENADRRNVSNLHLPGVPIEHVTDSRMTGFALGLLQDFADKSCETIITNDGSTFVPTTFRRAAPQSGRPLTEGFPQDTVRIMRRRTVGLGS